MKKRLLIITSILLFTSQLYPQSKINKDNLVQYGGKWFRDNDDKPYTGIVFELSTKSGTKIFESEYVQGKPNGKQTEWWENGNKKEEGTYKDGDKVGKWIGFYENGIKMTEKTFNNEKLEVFYTMWNSKGNNKYVEGTIKNGKEEGLWTEWYLNGNKKEEIFYKGGRKDGLCTEWDRDKNKYSVGTYKNGTKVGSWTYFKKDGSVDMVLDCDNPFECDENEW